MYLHIYHVMRKNRKRDENFGILTHKKDYHDIREFDYHLFPFLDEHEEVLIKHHSIFSVDIDIINFNLNCEELFVDIGDRSIWLIIFDKEIMRHCIRIYEFEELNASIRRYKIYVD
jgi:hypothetical protein